MSTQDLLIEVGTEELPPKALKRLSEVFTTAIVEGLAKAELAHGTVTPYATPRRLAVLIEGLATAQQDKQVERRGPALSAVYDTDGKPTKAALGFARSCGLDSLEGCETLETPKGAWLIFRQQQAGSPTVQLVPGILAQALDRLPIPKRMRWGDLEAEFVRPVHWLVLLFGEQVIDCELLSVRSGRVTRGHRFHHPEGLIVAEPVGYAPLLESSAHVMPDFTARREAIRAQVMEVAAEVGGTAVIDAALLDEVTALVEWPNALLGNFEERFLEVPAEALISAMKGHQKYFHVVDAEGKLMPHFITISNIESREPERVREGNERVIRPRLSDADFFWTQDRKGRLADRLESLQSVVFQQKLGTLYDKSVRISRLARVIAERIGGNPDEAERAGLLCKCDLMSAMVGEFPELQGIMGTYYARHDGEPESVALAIDQHYMPRFAGDELPASHTGQAVAIADRLDTLVGIFGIGQPPTGDKDPFALRRASLGVLRSLIEKGLDLDLLELIVVAVEQYRSAGVELVVGVAEQLFDFMLERLRAYYSDLDVAADTFDAVHARRPTTPADFDSRIRAVTAFRALPEAQALAAANKRIHNILRKAEEAGENLPASVSESLLTEVSEQALNTRVMEMSEVLAPLFAARDYQGSLTRLAALREPVDAFFDAVMVMADDPAVRGNRLALLRRLADLFLVTADLSRLQS